MMKFHRIGYGLGMLGISLFFCSSLGEFCLADDASGGPVLHLENSVVVPHGDTISCYGAPVVTSSGGSPTVKNYDIEIHLSVGADGTLHADSVKMADAPVLPGGVAQFLPGEYVTIPNHDGTVTITGPVITPEGRQLWTYISKNVGFGGYALSNGTWTTGPTEGNSELQGLIAKDAVLPKNFTFGEDSSGSLVGVQQLGDKLVFARFDKVNNTDPVQYTVSGTCILQRKPPQAN